MAVGDMRLRSSAAALLAAEKRFRRVRDYKKMKMLLDIMSRFESKCVRWEEAA